MTLPTDLEELDKKSREAASTPTGLENRSSELESGLDDFEAQQAGLTPASAIPPAPSIDASVALVTPENADIMEGQQLEQATQPLPQKPANSWAAISKSPGFINLSPADKVSALHSYATKTRDYSQSLEGADANAIESRIADFIMRSHNELFPAPAPDNGVFHNIMAGGARLGADTIKGVFHAVSGLARKAAADNTQPGWIEKLMGDSFDPFGVADENRKKAGQFLTDAADFWKGQAENVQHDIESNPLLADSKGAKVGELAAGLVGPLVMGLPGFIAEHRMQSYGETYNATGDHVKAERAANLASIGDMLFVGQAEGVVHGLGTVLKKQGVSGIKAWAVKAAAATSGNVGASQLIKAAQAAADAPENERAKAFTTALNEVNLTDAGIQAGFGLLAAGSPVNRSKKITVAHKELQTEIKRAAELEQQGLPKSGAAIREAAKADFEQRVKEVDAIPAAEAEAPKETPTAQEPNAAAKQINESEAAKTIEQVAPEKSVEPNEVVTPETVKTEELPAEVRKDAEETFSDDTLNNNEGNLTWRKEEVPIAELSDVLESERNNPDSDFWKASKKLAAEIKKSGRFQPIVIGPESVEGNHRIAAAEILGLETVPAYRSEFAEQKESNSASTEPTTATASREEIGTARSASLTETADELGLTRNQGTEENGNIMFTPKDGGTSFVVAPDATPDVLRAKYEEVKQRMKGTPEQLAQMEELKAKRAAKAAAKNGETPVEQLSPDDYIAHGSKDMTADELRINHGSFETQHSLEIDKAIKAGKPISSQAFDTYNTDLNGKINLPEGYVKEGDQYVFKPEAKGGESNARQIESTVSETEKSSAAQVTEEGGAKSTPASPEPKKVVAPKAVKPAAPELVASAPKPTQSLAELAHSTKRDLNKAVKLPKGATSIRVTDAKGRKTVLTVKDLNGLNPLHEAGPFKKVEAGTIAKGNVFTPMKEEIGLRAELPEDEGFDRTAQGAESDRLPSEAIREKRQPSNELDASEELGATPESSEAAQSAIKESATAHKAATVQAVADALRERGAAPVPNLEEQIAKRYSVFDKAATARGADTAARDHLHSLLRDELLDNVAKTGDAFKTLNKDGQTVDYSASAHATTKLQDYRDKISDREVTSLDKKLSEDSGTSNTTVADIINKSALPDQKIVKDATPVGNEHPESARIRGAVGRHFAAFSKSISVPLGRAKSATRAEILEAAHLVYQKLTGADFRSEVTKGRPNETVEILRVNPEFQKAVKERIADRITQDVRAGVTKEREALQSKGDSNLTAEENAAVQKAVEQIKAKVSFTTAINALPESLRKQTRKFQTDYSTFDGIQGVLRKIAVDADVSPEGKLQAAMATALKGVVGDVPVIVDPTQIERGGGVGIFKPSTKTIGLYPFLSKTGSHWTALHEAGHSVRYEKVYAYLRGEHEKLSSADLGALQELDGLYKQVLSHADTPEAIRKAASSSNLDEQVAAYNEAKALGLSIREHYPLLNLHEFMEGALSDKVFQERLNNIKLEQPAGLKSEPSTIWSRIKQLMRQLTFGGKALDENSVLARAFDRSIDVAKSGSIESQLARREESLRSQASNDEFRQDNEKQIQFLGDFSRDHGYSNVNELAVEAPTLYNQAAKIYRDRVSQTREEPGLMSMAAEDTKVQDETAKRASGMFKLIDGKNLAKGPAEQVVRDAMTNGAATAEEFSKAFQNAGVKPEQADAIGGLIESHFNLAGHEKAIELQSKTLQQAAERNSELAEPIAEDVAGEPTITSIKNAQVDTERVKRGLPSAFKAARKEFSTTWDRALERIDKTPDAAEDLVAELKGKARPLNDEENAMLLHRQITLQSEYREASDALVTAQENGNIDQKAEARVKMAQASDNLLDVYNAGRKAGTENARGLVTRKMLAREDYSLANMVTTKRAALGGAELNEAQTAEITRLHKRIFDLNEKLVDRANQVDEKASEQQGEVAVDDMRKRAKIKPSGDLDGQRKNIVQAMRDQMAETGDPADLRRYAQKLAENYVARGIDKLQTVSRAVHEVMKGIAPELTERNVRDMISGYGDYKQLSKDAVKVALRDLKGKLQQAAKLDDMLQQGKAPSKTGVEGRNQSDHERRLTKLVEEAKKTGDYFVTDPATQLKTALDAIQTRAKNSIKDMAFQMETGEKPLKGQSSVEYDLQTEKLKALQERVRETLTEVEGKPELSDEQRIINTMRALEKEYKFYDERLKADDFSLREKGKGTPVTPEVEALRARTEAVKAEYKELEAILHPERETERSLAGWRTRTTNSIAEYLEKTASGDFAPKPVREPLRLTSPSDMQLKADVERAKNEFELGKRKDLYAKRGRTEKILDALAKFGRASKLTAISTLGKLVLAAAHRAATTPIEEAIGSGLKQLPGVKQVFARAPLEGRGLNIKVEAKAITEGLTQGIIDGYDIIVKGESDLDAVFGKKLKMPREWYDWAGGIWHGALKAPIKRATYTRELEGQLKTAGIRGEDISDPGILTRYQLAAYKKANASIFMNDNMVVDGYKRMVSRWEERNKETGNVSGLGKTGATVARVLVPIVKVPTNYVAEAFTHVFGVASGSTRLARALYKGVENLHPDEADLIARHLKKGSLGAAVLLVGFLNPAPSLIQAGGYYQHGEKRKQDDVEAGGLRVFGYDVPKWATHTPLLEVLQLGATTRRVMEERLHGKPKGLTAGAWAGALGLAEEVPFLETMFNSAKLKEAPGQYFGDIAKGVFVPSALNNIAVWTDRENGKSVKRKPKTVLDQLKTGVPGLRQTVPKKPNQ